MAQAQRDAWNANMGQLVNAIPADDEEAQKSAVFGLANLLFFQLDRIADSLEMMAKLGPAEVRLANVEEGLKTLRSETRAAVMSTTRFGGG